MAFPVRNVAAPRRRPVDLARRDRRQAADIVRAELAAASRPQLRIVPRRRTAANAVVLLVGLIAVLMLAAVVLHTRLAERQLEIDKTEQAVEEAKARFDVLRRQRAELRSPNRLAAESAQLGLAPAPGTDFVAIDPRTLAEVIAAAGAIDEDTGLLDAADPLDQVRRVRAAAGGD